MKLHKSLYPNPSAMEKYADEDGLFVKVPTGGVIYEIDDLLKMCREAQFVQEFDEGDQYKYANSLWLAALNLAKPENLRVELLRQGGWNGIPEAHNWGEFFCPFEHVNYHALLWIFAGDQSACIPAPKVKRNIFQMFLGIADPYQSQEPEDEREFAEAPAPASEVAKWKRAIAQHKDTPFPFALPEQMGDKDFAIYLLSMVIKFLHTSSD